MQRQSRYMRRGITAEHNCMSYPTKIATCCFCGSKAALTLGAGRHELACAQCGAPLHDLKQIPLPRDSEKPNTGGKPAAGLRKFPHAQAAAAIRKPKHRKVKKKKTWMTKIAREVADVIDDIFD